MSSNPKQTATGGPQTQRYPSTYQPMSQTGGREGYPVSNPAGAYVQAPGNQGGNQGPGGLRGIPQTAVPPSSTPPNVDLKVQPLPPQSTINPTQLMFSQSVRPAQQFYQTRQTAPSSQNPRMASHNNRPQQMFHQTLYPVQQQPVYIPFNTGNRQNFVQTVPVFTGPHFQYPFNTPTTPQGALPYFYNPPTMVPRASTMPNPLPATPNPSQPAVQMPMVSNNTQPQNFQKPNTNKRRPNAIKVIDPNTGLDRLDEVLGENSHPPSGESSARQTPQPSVNQNTVKEIQATFAKKVMQAINTDSDNQQRLQDDEEPPHHPQQHHLHHHSQMPPPPNSSSNSMNIHQPPGHPHLNPDVVEPHSNFQQPPVIHNHPPPHIEHPQLNQYPPPPHPVQMAPPPTASVPPPPIISSSSTISSNVPNAEPNLEHIVRTSPFNALAKEFVSSNSNSTAKETTPVVSANCDAEEVTLPPKLHKDRESPSKSRKLKEHLQQKISASSAAVSVPEQSQPPVDRSTSSSTTTTTTSDDKMVEGKKFKDSSSTITTNLPQVISKEVIPEEVPDTKKGQKKEKVEQKAEVPEVESQIPHPPAVVQPEVLSNAKPKQNARNASKQGNQQQQQQQQQNAHQNNNNQKSSATTVPQSQPPKSSNKSHKKNDINQKGANKEGTDMDAFNDNTVKETKETVTSNNVAINDIINANSHLSNNVSAAAATNNNNSKGVINSVNNEINNKKIESNDTTNNSSNMTIKSTPTAPPAAPPSSAKPKTNKVDVTSIVREQPKVSIKPLPSSNSSTDEIDRAAPAVDTLNANNNNNNVNKINSSKISSEQMANNATPKANSENNNRIETKLPYQDGQWAPTNPSGLKVYQKEFLLALRDSPNSKIKPEKILDQVAADDRGRLGDGRASMGGRTDFTNPPFNSYGGGGKSGSQRGNGPKRNSSQSKQGMGGGNKNVKPPQAKVSISLREDVKLHESENAWKPARFAIGASATDDDRKTEQLYKKVRGILNKLTPQKFDTLLGQIKGLQIDNSDRLQGVIDLVFDKAVDEPNFSVAYAKMCKELALMHVPMSSNSTAPEKKEEFVNFRKILITRCQMEFEKQSVDESTRNAKLKEIDECTDPDKKKDLQFDLEEYDRKLRMKSVGNVRFIGELFKQEMLTLNIMVRCLYNLLENKDEESLECLCKLLTTIGKELESKGVDLTQIFNTMKAIADRKENTKVSSRIRFMLQDVIDLRQSKWVPRRQDLNPKTIDQIQKEAEKEQRNIEMMNSVPITPRKDDRMGGGGGMGSMSLDRKGGRGGRNVSDDGWVTNQRSRGVFTVQSDKLKSKAPLIDEPLGSMSAFQNWGKGAQGSKFSSQQLTNTSNPYSALENNYMDSDKRLGSSRSKDPYSSKGPSLERNFNKYDGRGSRSGSQHRSANEPSSAALSQRSTPAPMLPPISTTTTKSSAPPLSASIGNPSSAPVSNSTTSSVPQMSEEQMDRSINNSIDEYISGNAKIDEFFQAITSCIPTTYYPNVISTSYLHVFEKSQHDRLKSGELFAKLVKDGQFSLEDYCIGLRDILSQADDLKIDIPKFWDYLAEILVDMVIEEALPLDRLFELSKKQISQSDISKLLACLFKLVVAKKGAAHLQKLWQRSGLRFTDFLENAHVRSYVQDNQVQFLLDGSAPTSQKQITFEEIQEHLSALLRKKASHDEIFSWITENVCDKVKENKFIRALATSIFEDSISPNFKLQKDVLLSHTNLLLKYIDNNPHAELEGLYALQALIHKLEHPQGLLLEICTTLLDSLIFSQESFVAWEQSNDPAEQEGKGVAIKQLTAFITQLKENDDDDDDTSVEDA